MMWIIGKADRATRLLWGIRGLLFIVSLGFGLAMGRRHYEESVEAATVNATGWFFIIFVSVVLSWELIPWVQKGLHRWARGFNVRLEELVRDLVCRDCREAPSSCSCEDPKFPLGIRAIILYASVSYSLIGYGVNALVIWGLVLLVSIGDIPYWAFSSDTALLLFWVWLLPGAFVTLGQLTFILWAEITLARVANRLNRSASVSAVAWLKGHLERQSGNFGQLPGLILGVPRYRVETK